MYQEINEAGGTASDRSLICNGDQNQSWLSSSADWATGCMIGVGDYFVNIGKPYFSTDETKIGLRNGITVCMLKLLMPTTELTKLTLRKAVLI